MHCYKLTLKGNNVTLITMALLFVKKKIIERRYVSIDFPELQRRGKAKLVEKYCEKVLGCHFS